MELELALGRLLDDTGYSRELGKKRARRCVESHFSAAVVGEQLRQFLLQEPENHLNAW